MPDTVLAAQVLPVLWGASVVLLLAASLSDIALRTIPDLVSLALVAIGVLLRAMDGNLLAGSVAGVSVFVLAALCSWCGWMGGGDVKLLAACALLVPPERVFSLLMATGLSGAGLAFLYLALRRVVAVSSSVAGRRRPIALGARLWRVELWRIRSHGPLPYGCAIAAAAVFVLLER